MNCQCQGIEEVFGQEYATKELNRYHLKGAAKTTRMLTAALKACGVDGLTLLDIGGGVGAVQHALLEAGVRSATSVDASSAYVNTARSEAQRRGLSDRVNYQFGNFVDVAEDVVPADIVTLDRVICCYPDMQKLVSLSAGRARKLYGLVYPRYTWWIRLGLAVGNFLLRLQRSPFRTFSHPTQAVEAVLKANGLKRQSYSQTLIWQVVVFSR